LSTRAEGYPLCYNPLIESFAFSNKDGISFDEIRIKCLREREYDVHNQSYPNNRLRLFIFKPIGVQGGYTRYKYTSPAKGEAYVSVEMNLLEKIGSGKVALNGII